MALINSTEEIEKVITISGGFDFDNLLPFMPAAELEIQKLLGSDLFDELTAYYEAGLGDIEEFEAIIPIIHRPLVYFAFDAGFDILNVSIGENGIGVISSTSLAPASKARTDSARSNMISLAHLYSELLLKYLEKNEASFPDWTSSEAYSQQTEFLLRNALIFHKWYRINQSRLTYLQWIPSMRDAEIYEVATKISSELLQELKDQSLADNLSEANQMIIDEVCKAIAYFTAAAEKNNDRLKGQALKYIGAAQRYINSHADDFPTFKDSDIYVEPKIYESFENEEDNTVFVFGGGM